MTALQRTIDTTGDVDVLNQAESELRSMTIGLISHCVKHGHFSVLEQASMAVNIKTSRAIAAQLLRHDAEFQEFSQRYSTVTDVIETPEMRMCTGSNRDRSVSDENPWITAVVSAFLGTSKRLYVLLINLGVHPESARMILPLCTPTYLHMATNMRTWFFYLKSRLAEDAQSEHNDVAKDIYALFKENYPLLAEVFDEYNAG